VRGMPSRMKVPMMGLCSAVVMVQPPKTLRGMVGVKQLQPLQQLAQILKSPYTVTYTGKIGHALQPYFGTRALSFENL
jgi:hypothetical protein